MSINIGPATIDDMRPRITVIGVGGAGGNAIANMIEADIEGVDFIVANTDAQALGNAASDARIQLGPEITGGLGAGARPEVGKAAAEETVSDIEEALEGVNMCFIAAGMGGGTGTGAAPVIAEAARRMGVLTVGVVTKPFLFEGTRRMRAAEAGIEELQRHVDTLIVIPNQNLFLIAKADTTFIEAFRLADEVLQQGVRSITDLMVMPGLINLDFADVKSVMEEMGKAMMGTGEGQGENRALEAAERAIANPLLDGVSMQGAKAVIISILGGEDMKLLEVDEAANHIRELVDEDANIILGSAFNADLEGRIRVSVVATGIDSSAELRENSGETHSLRMGGGQAPKRPVLDLPAEDEADDEAVADQPVLAKKQAGLAAGLAGLSGMGAGTDRDDDANYDANDDDEDEDVDDIVDPLAGIRNEREDEDDDFPDPAFDDEHNDPASDRAGAAGSGSHADNPDGNIGHGASNAAQVGDADGRGELSNQNDRAARQPLDLTAETGDSVAAGDIEIEPQNSQDELLLDADRLAKKDAPVQPASQPPAPGRRRGLVSGSNNSSPGGSTLFERMANLSRGNSDSKNDEDDDDHDSDSSSLNIPRFLGRQNNQ